MEDRLVPSIDLSGVEWRTINGTNNNAAVPNQGAAETEQIRFGYGDRFVDDNGDVIITAPQRENPRTISNAIHDQDSSVRSERQLTDWIFQWGQWITHDLDLTRNGAEFNVLSEARWAISASRSKTRTTRCSAEQPVHPVQPLGSSREPGRGRNREVVNSIASYIDASLVYGSDDVRRGLCARSGMASSRPAPNGQLLPLNTLDCPTPTSSVTERGCSSPATYAPTSRSA